MESADGARRRAVDRRGRLDPSDLMSAAETARLLGCSPRQVYLLADKGSLPGARRLGRSLLVVRPVLERWLLTGSAEALSAPN